jgi:hypothetical protein
MSVRFRYEVIDRKTGKSVLENEATLECADRPVTVPVRDPLPAVPVVIEPRAPAPPPDVPPANGRHSLAALRLGVVDLALLRDDSERFRGALVLAPYSTIGDFAGGLQLGITNTTGEHPWGTALAPKGKAKTEDVSPPEGTTFRGFAQIGVVDANGGDFHGFTQLGLLASTGGSFRGGFQLGALGAGAGGDSALALQLGGLFAMAKNISGVQVGGLLSWAESLNGVQIGAGAMASGTVRGLQISGGNMVFPTRDGHASMEGAQIAEWNFASSLTGLQIGVLNVATHARGLQIGAFNYAKTLHGMQIGAINIIANGPVPFLPGINLAFDG